MKRLETLFFVSSLILVLLLIGQPVYASGEPGTCPNGYKNVRPVIIGGLSLVEAYDLLSLQPSVIAVFRGKCGWHDVTLSRALPGDLSGISSPKDLINFILPQSGFPGCHSAQGGEDLIVTHVNEFWKVEDLDGLIGYNYLTAIITVANRVCK
jgi:hypothetical protein